MATNKYSLADYILTIIIPEDASIDESIRGKSYSIGGAGIENGGKGSFLNQISIERNKDAWSTEGDATGSWVHNKNNDKTGEIEIQIRQISDDVLRLAQLCKIYENIQDNAPGFDIQITTAYKTAGSNIVAKAVDCMVKKLPKLELQTEAQFQNWIFTCGQVFEY